MKSLDIVNLILEEKENECYKAYGIFLEKQIKELRQIKKDLEVLEILRKCLFVEEIHRGGDDYVEGLEIYLDVTDDDENCYDFHKVKQWLEEKNHDN